jgi:periplasmic protein TonB
VQVHPRDDAYSIREIALAAGVPEERIRAVVGRRLYVPYSEALRVGRAVRRDRAAISPPVDDPLFSIFSPASPRAMTSRVPLVVSSTMHLGLIAVAVLIATLPTAPTATTLGAAERPEAVRLVFSASPGPGGGGGGGGLLQKAPPPKALREGHRALSSPVPIRHPPPPIELVAAPPEPKPAPLASEALPIVVAPIVSAPADSQNRIGILMQTSAETDSHGPGRGNGVGSGAGTGVGEGDGAGIGPGSGGGIGGGPYRGGSGIEPPRLLREVKADYTEEARQRRIAGDVILEIVVRRDGTVGDVKVLQGLGSGLNDRAVQAVRQWRFAAARRQGTPVDVIVEVAVEFKIR